MDGSRDDITEVGSCRSECSGDGGELVGREFDCSPGDCIPKRWMASLDAFSRMYFLSASVRPGKVSETSMRRTSVGEP